MPDHAILKDFAFTLTFLEARASHELTVSVTPSVRRVLADLCSI